MENQVPSYERYSLVSYAGIFFLFFYTFRFRDIQVLNTKLDM